MRRLCILLVLLVAKVAFAQQAQLQTARQAYADVPFPIAIVVEGFAETPTPKVEPFKIAGAKVRFTGVSPSFSTVIINGSIRQTTRFVFRYEITAPAGALSIPPMTVTQDGNNVTTQGRSLQVAPVQTTRKMRIELVLPKRPIWIGETVDVVLRWTTQASFDDLAFTVPLFENRNLFRIDPPSITDGQKTFDFQTESGVLTLPVTQERRSRGGQEELVFEFKAKLTALAAGNLDVSPSVASAKLQVGTRRDAFGFPTARYQLAQAADQKRTLEVKPLPSANRPVHFSGAIGESFSITVQAKNTVVRVGDPILLDITIKANTDLTGLSLPDLSQPQLLPPQKFSLIESAQTGELSNDGTQKSFQVQLRANQASVREIPALPFSFFDPTRGDYRTVYSEKIALSVAGGTTVGADSVIGKTTGKSPKENSRTVSSAAVDLTLSSTTVQGAPGRSLQIPWWLPIAFYGAAFVIAGFIIVRRRNEQSSSKKKELADAKRELLALTKRAAKEPSGEIASSLARSLQRLSTLTHTSNSQLIEELENLAFNPQQKNSPVPSAVLTRLKDVATQASKTTAKNIATSIVFLSVFLVSASLSASPRELYKQALTEPSPTEKRALFAQAQQLFEQNVPKTAGDWINVGNAALGAGNWGSATYSYKRALQLSESPQALQNLAWLERQLPNWAVAPQALDSLTRFAFWQDWQGSTKHLLASLLFCCGVVFLCTRKRTLKQGAVLLLIGWGILLASALVHTPPPLQGVVLTNDTTLRSANSDGAPSAFDRTLPDGAVVEVLEEREDWVRIAVGDVATGWVLKSHIGILSPLHG